jgi:hypothetical protein
LVVDGGDDTCSVYMRCWWHYNKCVTLLGLQVQSVAAREIFPTRVTRGLYQTLGKQRRSFFQPCLATCKAMSFSCAPNSTVWLSSKRLRY